MELNQLIDDAETASKAVVEEAEPLTGDKDLKADEISSCAKAVEQAVEESNQKMKLCTDFVLREQVAMRDTPPIDGEPVPTCAQDLNKCLARINEVKKAVGTTQASCGHNKVKKLKRAVAMEEVEKQMLVFKKYAKGGTLSRKDIMGYAKGEFSFTIPLTSLDQICEALIEEGAKGVSKENFYRVRAAVGLAREVAADIKRREEREEREKQKVKAKEALQVRIEEAKAVVESAEETIKKAEVETGPSLNEKTAAMEAADITTVVEEVDAAIAEAKSCIAGAKQKVSALNEDVDEDLKDFMKQEVGNLDQLTKTFEARIAKANAAASKVRCESVKKAGGKLFKVVKDTIVTAAFSLAGDKDDTRKLKDSTRKLKEVKIEEKEAAAKEEESGLMRMKVRVISDGQIGWATSVGNTGIVFLEAEE